MPEFKTFSEVFLSDESLSKFRDFIEIGDVLNAFDEIFPDLKKFAKAVKVEKNILYLSVSNSVWKSELNFKQNIIIEKINKQFNKSVIKSVRFI